MKIFFSPKSERKETFILWWENGDFWTWDLEQMLFLRGSDWDCFIGIFSEGKGGVLGEGWGPRVLLTPRCCVCASALTACSPAPPPWNEMPGSIFLPIVLKLRCCRSDFTLGTLVWRARFKACTCGIPWASDTKLFYLQLVSSHMASLQLQG